jgi:hypothetical protein
MRLNLPVRFRSSVGFLDRKQALQQRNRQWTPFRNSLMADGDSHSMVFGK